jgi:cysteine desulfurase / selenocysteine lyase
VKLTGDIRSQFPILATKVNGQPLVYLDNAATTQKPLRVIEKMNQFYFNYNSNIHRGVHMLSRTATELYENARKTCAAFFNAADPQQIVFTAGTTDSINTVAQGLAKKLLSPGDEIIVSEYEHHSNILPWQMWAEENNGKLRVLPLNQNHSLDLGKLPELINDRTRVIAIAHVSNTLGIVTDIEAVKKLISGRNIVLMVDGAQSAPHMDVDLQKMAPDFFVCSAHKMYGPTGTGILYLSERWLKELPVTRPGGGTIKTVTFEKTEYETGPLRFEAGTPNIAGVIGFAEAIEFINETGKSAIVAHETALTTYAHQLLAAIPEVEVYGYAEKKAAVISFNRKKQP